MAGGDRARDLERLERLRPIDDDFMRTLFRSDLTLAQHVLRVVTGVADLELVEAETQRDVRWPAGTRSVVLDVWGRDSAGTWYDLEVQRGDDPRPRRARYHGSAMDAEALLRGADFEGLPERYVVFVMEGDPFGGGRGLYRYESLDVETGRPLGDGAHVLYASGAWRGDDELGRLMRDFCEADPGAMSPGPLRERVAYYKRDPEGVASMCEVFEEVRAEGEARGLERGRAEGRAEGRDQERLAGVASLMERLQLSAREAMDALGIPEADRARYLALL